MLTIQLHPEAAEIERQYQEQARQLAAWRDSEIERVVRRVMKEAGK